MFPQWPHLTPFPSTSGKSGPPPLGQVEPPARCADRTVARLWVPSGTGKAYQRGKVNSAVRKHALLFALAWKAILCHASPFFLLPVARFKSDFLGQCLLREQPKDECWWLTFFRSSSSSHSGNSLPWWGMKRVERPSEAQSLCHQHHAYSHL